MFFVLGCMFFVLWFPRRLEACSLRLEAVLKKKWQQANGYCHFPVANYYFML
jgi:hypothetical protein